MISQFVKGVPNPLIVYARLTLSTINVHIVVLLTSPIEFYDFLKSVVELRPIVKNLITTQRIY